jgi:hypothetical protein
MANPGADNLLINCLKVKPGDEFLLVLEPDQSLYENEVGAIIENRCRALGASVTIFREPLIQHASEFPQALAKRMHRTDHTLFLSRLGDYVRFLQLPGNGTRTTSYTYTAAQLASPFASMPHALMATLRDKLESELLQAMQWRITCPLGTDISGTFCWPSLNGGDDDELHVALFPVSTFKPVPGDTASGTVALSRWLMPGGSPKLESPGISFDGVVHCEVAEGEIQRFHGEAASAVEQHYDRIANTLGINRNRVHSWHLGINPQTLFPVPVEQDFDRWCATSFGSPRYLHFHTCGDEPPGEAAWSLFNCDVTIDSETYWRHGEFVWLQRRDNRELIDEHTDAAPLLVPSQPIGI